MVLKLANSSKSLLNIGFQEQICCFSYHTITQLTSQHDFENIHVMFVNESNMYYDFLRITVTYTFLCITSYSKKAHDNY